MASSRKVGTNEEIATYGTGKTYTSLVTWEADTDIDLVTAAKSCVLEVYGNSYNDGNCVVGGATTDASYFRIIRPASGNKLTSGAISTKHFNYKASANTALFSLQENYTEIQDLVVRRYANYNGNVSCMVVNGHQCGYVGCVVIDTANIYSGQIISGFYISGGMTADQVAYAKNCLSHNCDGQGFYLAGNFFSTSPMCQNCTAINNGSYGFDGDSSTRCKCYGCGSDGNGSGDFSAKVGQVNCSSSTPTFAAGTDNFHLDSTDTVWKDADTNTGSWHSSCGYDDDIDGNIRTGTWDIGWHEYTEESTGHPTMKRWGGVPFMRLNKGIWCF